MRALRTRIGAVKLGGPAAALPGGEVKVALGAEYAAMSLRTAF